MQYFRPKAKFASEKYDACIENPFLENVISSMNLPMICLGDFQAFG